MERDVTKDTTRDYFVQTLRRIADAVEKNESFRIQIAGERLSVPADAGLSVEHEASDGAHEIELQLTWRD
jgi:amphi-Trp domain-containing protein